jgi:DNA-binding response OmpR family regulator
MLSEPPPVAWIIVNDPDDRESWAAAARQLGLIGVPLESAALALDLLPNRGSLIPDLILFDDFGEPLPPARFATGLTRALDGLAPSVIYVVSSREAADGLASAALRPGRDMVFQRPVLARDVIRGAFALLGRSAKDQPVLQACGLELDVLRRMLVYQDRNVHLTRFECGFMDYVMRRKERVVTADELLEHVWGFEPGTGSCEVLRAHVRNLRHKLEFLGASRDLIWTLPGRGYQLRPDPTGQPLDTLSPPSASSTPSADTQPPAHLTKTSQ